ncbi:MAG: hypothetical protein IJ710_05480, partial [Prevotella sp.]|nr:hypothetical protein [Prevotella sp.]
MNSPSAFRAVQRCWLARVSSWPNERKTSIRFVLLSTFRNIAEKSAKLLPLGIKINEFILFCPR